MTRFSTIAGAAALAFLASACSAPSAERPSVAVAQGTEQPGQQLLAATARALGTERALRAALTLHADYTGTSYAGEQARSPSEPIGEAGRVYRWRFDPARQTLIRDADQTFPGGIRFSSRAALTAEGGWTVDLLRWRTGDDLIAIPTADALRNRLQWERFLPHLLIAQARASAATLEAAGADGLRFRDAAGQLIEVMLDPVTRRPLRAAQVVEGKRQSELAYLDYGRRHGVMMPARLQVYQGDRLQEDLRLGRTLLAPVEQALLAPPPGYAPPPAAGEPTAREIAPGVLFFENMPGNYHSMAVDMDDHVVLVEAPLSPAYAELQKRILSQLRPDKPVRYVLVTHHHGDHNGGLRTWAEAGATIVVPRGARIAIERQLQARGFAGTARIEEVESLRSFGSGGAGVDAHVFASSHAEAHMLVHVPRHALLFQGDLFYLPERGMVPPAFPVVREFVEQIETLGLNVETVAGVHGRPGTMEEVRESLRRSEQQRRISLWRGAGPA